MVIAIPNKDMDTEF